MTTETAVSGSRGRKRGGPLRINRDKIVEAARTLDPQTLTMQAVADELGVDRKALNYHVTDREGLLRLIAADVFEGTCAEAFQTYFDARGVAPDDDWRAAVRTWAVTVRDSLVATGIVSNYFPLGADSVRVLEPAEFVLQQLLRAGFDLPTAGRALTGATRLAMGVGRDVLLAAQSGEHPQVPEVRRLLEEGGDATPLEAFRGLAELEINSPRDIETQFEFELDVFVTGLQSRLHPA